MNCYRISFDPQINNYVLNYKGQQYYLDASCMEDAENKSLDIIKGN